MSSTAAHLVEEIAPGQFLVQLTSDVYDIMNSYNEFADLRRPSKTTSAPMLSGTGSGERWGPTPTSLRSALGRSRSLPPRLSPVPRRHVVP